jgi:hypothetical protein
MINYNKVIHNKKDFPYPYIMCKEWTITANGIIINGVDNKLRQEIILTPSSFDLLLWKSAYYDRGLKSRHLFPDSMEFK